jgi:hypothetical protein
VAENHDGSAVGGWEIGQSDRLVGQFHADDARAVGPLALEPAGGVADPVDAAGPA